MPEIPELTGPRIEIYWIGPGWGESGSYDCKVDLEYDDSNPVPILNGFRFRDCETVYYK